jgi:DNA-binding FadR family transcriptional regulator
MPARTVARRKPEEPAVPGRPQRRLRLAQPTLAEMIAGTLRDRILSGEIEGSLPKQEQLIAEFRVSAPSLREALRVLQSEGLVTVQRGNVGGAAVHVPHESKVAYTLAMILQAKATTLDDVAEAMSMLEPLCARACAVRRDRGSTVVPRLSRLLEESRDAAGDAYAFMVSARRFHEEMVRGCGNATITVMVGTLETLWSAHVANLARRTAPTGVMEDRALRLRSVKEHQALLTQIAKGDAAGAERAARAHLSEPGRTHMVGRRLPVQAAALGDL